MEVTEVSIQKNNCQRYNIFIDGQFMFSAEIDDVAKYSLKEGMLLHKDQLDSLIEKCEFTKAFHHSLKMLAIRDHSMQEISEKLEKSGYSQQTIENILAKLMDLGFIDDQRYQDKFIKDSIYLKKHGIKRIEYELKKKGISDSEAEISNDYSEIIYENAMELAKKKLKQLEGKKDIRGKIFRYLAGKGYEYDMIREIVEKTCNSQQDFSEFEQY